MTWRAIILLFAHGVTVQWRVSWPNILINFASYIVIQVPIQGPLRTPKKPFLNARMRLEIGASLSQVLKLPLNILAKDYKYVL